MSGLLTPAQERERPLVPFRSPVPVENSLAKQAMSMPKPQVDGKKTADKSPTPLLAQTAVDTSVQPVTRRVNTILNEPEDKLGA